MKKIIASTVLMVTIFYSGLALAALQTVTLAIEGMYCPSCPYIVQKSIESVDGVQSVVVSREKETAVVTFDDAKTKIETLTDATLNAGYPSKLAKNVSEPSSDLAENSKSWWSKLGFSN